MTHVRRFGGFRKLRLKKIDARYREEVASGEHDARCEFSVPHWFLGCYCSKRKSAVMNIYYSPEEFGLKTLGEIEFSSGRREFDLTVVWKDENGETLYHTQDSGYPSTVPFEGFGLDDLEPIPRLQDFIDHLTSRSERFLAVEQEAYDHQAKIAALIEKVKVA